MDVLVRAYSSIMCYTTDDDAPAQRLIIRELEHLSVEGIQIRIQKVGRRRRSITPPVMSKKMDQKSTKQPFHDKYCCPSSINGLVGSLKLVRVQRK